MPNDVHTGFVSTSTHPRLSNVDDLDLCDLLFRGPVPGAPWRSRPLPKDKCGPGMEAMKKRIGVILYVSCHLARCHTCVGFGVDGQVVALDGFGYD